MERKPSTIPTLEHVAHGELDFGLEAKIAGQLLCDFTMRRLDAWKSRQAAKSGGNHSRPTQRRCVCANSADESSKHARWLPHIQLGQPHPRRRSRVPGRVGFGVKSLTR